MGPTFQGQNETIVIEEDREASVGPWSRGSSGKSLRFEKEKK
jgi:hypothetical protein